MKNDNLIMKSWCIRDDNGNDLRVEETEDRMHVVVSIMQVDDRSGRINTVALNYDQWEAFRSLCDRYGSDRPFCEMAQEPEPEPEPEKVEALPGQLVVEKVVV